MFAASKNVRGAWGGDLGSRRDADRRRSAWGGRRDGHGAAVGRRNDSNAEASTDKKRIKRLLPTLSLVSSMAPSMKSLNSLIEHLSHFVPA